MVSNTTIKVGRRKTAVARAYLTQGSGKFVINGKEALQFLKRDEFVTEVQRPLALTNMLGTYDVKINVFGGGVKGQIGAIKLAVSRAIVRNNEELRSTLRQNGMLTRDPRMVERKKYGRPKARKRFQFSKR